MLAPFRQKLFLIFNDQEWTTGAVRVGPDKDAAVAYLVPVPMYQVQGRILLFERLALWLLDCRVGPEAIQAGFFCIEKK